MPAYFVAEVEVTNPAGYALHFFSGGGLNTISQSTITSNAAGYSAVYFNGGSSNTITNSYIQGSTAIYVSGSTGTVINSSVLVATNTAGMGVESGCAPPESGVAPAGARGPASGGAARRGSPISRSCTAGAISFSTLSGSALVNE